MKANVKSTQIIFSISTQPTGAIIQQQRAELSLMISDRLERLWYSLIITIAALLLAGDDMIGQFIYEAQRTIDTIRLGLFIILIGAKLCFVEIAS